MADEQKHWFATREITFRLPINWFRFVVVSAFLLIAAFALVSEQTRPAVYFIGVVVGSSAALLFLRL